MSIVFGLENVGKAPKGRAVAVGVFDGVHWGHRAIFDRLRQAAAETGVTSCALTFERHPAELLAPDRAPAYINTLEQRTELILAAGVEEVVVVGFDSSLASLSHELFLREVLFGNLAARQLTVGSNFRFGADRSGDIRYLQQAAPALGMAVDVVGAVIIGGGPASSTRVRALIDRGDVEDAAAILGRRFTLRGTVTGGRQVGRRIGFPTANLDIAPRQLLPARGVYAVEAAIGGVYRGVCNIGIRPTFGRGGQTVEVHLDGFRGDIYGRSLDVVFVRRLRDEMVFDSPEHLAEQIRRDLERADSNS